MRLKHPIFILLFLIVASQSQAGQFGCFNDGDACTNFQIAADTLVGTIYTADSTGVLDSLKVRVKSYGFSTDDYWRGAVYAYPTMSLLASTDSLLVADGALWTTIVLVFSSTDTIYADSQYVNAVITHDLSTLDQVCMVSSANDTVFLDPASVASIPSTYTPVDTIADSCVNMDCYTTYVSLSNPQVIFINTD
jgi:hypothetical protein